LALLKKRHRIPHRIKRRIRAHGAVRCPLAGHQVGWCRGLCKPVENRGICGRVAAHSLQGRTQLAIASEQAREPDTDDRNGQD
jgi:hypothetical protein